MQAISIVFRLPIPITSCNCSNSTYWHSFVSRVIYLKVPGRIVLRRTFTVIHVSFAQKLRCCTQIHREAGKQFVQPFAMDARISYFHSHTDRHKDALWREEEKGEANGQKDRERDRDKRRMRALQIKSLNFRVYRCLCRRCPLTPASLCSFSSDTPPSLQPPHTPPTISTL